MRAAGVWAFSLCLSACGPPDAAAPRGPQVAVSVFPLYDLTRRVAGADLEVELLLPKGGDAHGTSLGPRQVARLAGVRLVVGVSPSLDGWSVEAARSAGSEPEVLWVGGGDSRKREPAESDDAVDDPHVWLDPVRMQTAVTRVAGALAALDPEGAPGYRERARSVSRELEALDAEIRRRAAGWPDRAVVAEHAFLGPFAERYGLRVVAVLEPVHGSELTPKRLSRILESIPSEGVAAILVPAGEGGAAARVAAEETGLPLRELEILGGAPGDRYESVLLAFVDALEEALG